VIFLTVGSSDPFDRMVRAVDEWAATRGRTDVFAQIGKAQYEPRHIEAVRFLSPSEFRERVRTAQLLVAHAGMGSIITALEVGRPVIIMPKRACLGEHRSDHQVATAKRLGQRQGIIVAWDEKDLVTKLDREGRLRTPTVIAPQASAELIATIRAFIAKSEKSKSPDA
jgi:UDP-N-acetylglucosamine transferase subunit ALG13